jgi:hypothetical protein
MSIPKISPRKTTAPGTMQLPAAPPETGRHRATATTPDEHRAARHVPAWKAARR